MANDKTPDSPPPQVPALSAAERGDLKARAHHLNPVVMIGDDGLTDGVLAETGRALKAHQLIKVRVAGDDRESRQAIAAELSARLGCAVVQRIGKLLVLWRPPADEDDPFSPTARRRPRKPIPKKRLEARIESGGSLSTLKPRTRKARPAATSPQAPSRPGRATAARKAGAGTAAPAGRGAAGGRAGAPGRSSAGRGDAPARSRHPLAAAARAPGDRNAGFGERADERRAKVARTQQGTAKPRARRQATTPAAPRGAPATPRRTASGSASRPTTGGSARATPAGGGRSKAAGAPRLSGLKPAGGKGRGGR